MLENQKIPFNFTYFAMKLLGKNLYSNPWTAVSEIVANGIDADAKNVYVLIDMRNKEKAIVEIFDDGLGMSIEDLRDKYTLIGRNKRLESDNRKGKTLGRKGIGKLAALYLSPRYYLYTKTEEGESAWCVNTQIIKDSDIPALMGTTYNTDMLISKMKWNEIKTGTMIHLSDVDLRKIGQERLKSLPLMLADYYLENVISTTVSVCVIENNYDKIKFYPISKNINFDTMFGIFDNTGLGYKNKLQSKVYITRDTVYKEVDIPRDTFVLSEEKYTTSGTMKLTNLDGQVVDIPYNMIGWIGIHSSLDNVIMQRNSPNAKKNQLHPNALRLYVRGKLAVSNLMPYIGSVAAFAPYIEGEISFDVLDDDMFEDASTSNREGYSLSDPRIQKLCEIVGKIINTLVVKRNDAGKKVNDEIKAIKEKIDAEAEAEKKKREDAEKAKAKAEENVKKLQAQNNTIFNAITEEQESFSAKTHLVKTNAIAIRNSVSTLAQKVGFDSYKEIGAIAISSDKILSSLKYSALAKFNIEDEYITVDLFEFCREYLETVLKKQYFEITFDVSIEGEYCVRFNPQYMSLILDNFISNSEKSKTTKFFVKMTSKGSSAIITIEDNGEGFGNIDLTSIFDFGFSNTGGTGIGLYNIKRAVEKMKGTISACENAQGGATFTIEF